MPTFNDVLSAANQRVAEVEVPVASQLASAPDPPRLIDVREKNEWDEGHIPGATHVPRGYLELRIEREEQ